MGAKLVEVSWEPASRSSRCEDTYEPVLCERYSSYCRGASDLLCA